MILKSNFLSHNEGLSNFPTCSGYVLNSHTDNQSKPVSFICLTAQNILNIFLEFGKFSTYVPKVETTTHASLHLGHYPGDAFEQYKEMRAEWEKEGGNKHSNSEDISDCRVAISFAAGAAAEDDVHGRIMDTK